jgi:hypothetical protein
VTRRARFLGWSAVRRSVEASLRTSDDGHRARAAGRWATLSVFAVIAVGASTACASKESRPAQPAQQNSAKPDWSSFGGHKTRGGAENVRVVPESPAQVTGVPYLRSLRLAWSGASEVPTWEPVNQTRELPGAARQAVLAIDVRDLPEKADVRVLWYFETTPDEPIYTDKLESAENGEHYFALCLRDAGVLAPLPKGAYRVELRNGAALIKAIPFEVGKSEEKP